MMKLLVCILLMGCNPFVNNECSEVVGLQKENIALLLERLELKDKRIDILKKTLKERGTRLNELLVRYDTCKHADMWVEQLPGLGGPKREGYYGITDESGRNRVVQVIDPRSNGHFVVYDFESAKTLKAIGDYGWYGRICFLGDE